MFTEDLTLFLSDFAVPVTAGAAAGNGILDINSEIVLGGNVVIVDYLLTAEASLFGSLAYGNPIYVNGEAFTVEHEPFRIDDGKLCRIPLTKNTAEDVPDFILDGDSGFDNGAVVIYDGNF